MRLAEMVTFGGSGLDRAAALRADPAAVAAQLARPEAGVLPLWRGKPLMAGEGATDLGWLPAGHPVLLDAEAPVLLGLDEGRPRFAADLTRWSPDLADAAANAAFFDPSEQHHPALPADHRFIELRAVMTALSPRAAELAATARALLGWHASHGFCARCGTASEVAQAGWLRRCPACAAEHYPRTDPVVIMLITRGNSVLMGRSPQWPEGMYSLLAGFVEPGETVEAAVRREVAEESGIRVGEVGYLASQPWPFPASLMLGCRGEALSEEITRDPAELEDALWVTREEMLAILAGQNPRIKPARKGAIAHFLIQAWVADRLE